MAAKRRTVSLTRRGFDFETFMWYFTRLSALAMYALAITGLVGALILGARTQMNMADLIRWVFTPNVTHVANTSIPDTAPWMTLFWKLTACAFVFFAGSHGLHGLLSVIEDYLTIRWLRLTLRILVFLLAIFLIYAGCYVIWTS